MKTLGKGSGMKKVILTGLFLFIAVFAINAQDLPSINILNNTGYTIYYIYVSPSESDFWGDDVLGDEILLDGETFTYQLPYPLSSVNVYDILLEDEDGDSYFQWALDLARNPRIVFTFDDIY